MDLLVPRITVPLTGSINGSHNQRLRRFFWGFAFHGSPLPTNRSRFPGETAAGPADRRARHWILQTESAAWLNTRKCAACHHVPIVLWSLSEAERQGYAIDKKFLTETVESLLGSKDKLMSSKIFPNPADPPDPRPQGRGLNMGLPFLAVAAQSLPSLNDGQKQSLKLIAEEIRQEAATGRLVGVLRHSQATADQRKPDHRRRLDRHGASRAKQDPTRRNHERAALAKATAWLAGTKLPENFQDKVFKVLLAARAGKPRDEMQSTIDELLALQRADGGWSQLAEAKSDAYATGQTLYVLALAGYTADRPEIKRAIDFLVATQKPDGSWPMTSRSTPDGRPGGAKLLTPITCAASAWATLGLARIAPKRP